MKAFLLNLVAFAMVCGTCAHEDYHQAVLRGGNIMADYEEVAVSDAFDEAPSRRDEEDWALVEEGGTSWTYVGKGLCRDGHDRAYPTVRFNSKLHNIAECKHGCSQISNYGRMVGMSKEWERTGWCYCHYDAGTLRSCPRDTTCFWKERSGATRRGTGTVTRYLINSEWMCFRD